MRSPSSTHSASHAWICLDFPSVAWSRKILLVGTGPEGGEDIMHIDSPDLKKIIDSNLLTGRRRTTTPSAGSHAITSQPHKDYIFTEYPKR